MGVRVRGNFPLLFLMFFAATTLLAGATYEAAGLFESSGAAVFGLALLAGSISFALSLLVTARILYKAAGSPRA